MLHHIRVLIAEDNPVVALGLALSVLDAEGEVVGPCASVSEALAAVAVMAPQAAILDIQLEDGEVTPVAKALMELGVPLVFHSGVPIPAPLIARDPDLCLCAKPAGPETVVRRLTELVDRAEARKIPDAANL